MQEEELESQGNEIHVEEGSQEWDIEENRKKETNSLIEGNLTTGFLLSVIHEEDIWDKGSQE